MLVGVPAAQRRRSELQALVISDIDTSPSVGDLRKPEPELGESLLAVVAAPLNPIDIWVASGRFFAGHPPVPYVPGVEAVGRVIGPSALTPGTLVFTCLDGLGVTRNGTCAEYVRASDSTLIPVPDEVEPAFAAALGTASLAGWIPLRDLARVERDDVVLVLGASGTAGFVAVQVAKMLGAARVVAVGRRSGGLERARLAGADAVVAIGKTDDLVHEFRAACGGAGPTVVFDPLWGEPLLAALEAAAPGARIVNVGQAAAAHALMASAVVRGKGLHIFGFTTLNTPFDDVRRAYAELLLAKQRGDLHIDVNCFSLTDSVAAWERQVAGPVAKLVICP